MGDTERGDVDSRLLEKVRRITQEILQGQAALDIVWETDLSTIDMDSLEWMAFWVAVEQEFGVKIPEKDIDSLSPVSSLVPFLKMQGKVVL